MCMNITQVTTHNHTFCFTWQIIYVELKGPKALGGFFYTPKDVGLIAQGRERVIPNSLSDMSFHVYSL
jgi:hypothetical protein